MRQIFEVTKAEAYVFPSIGGDKVLLSGHGKVRTSGWSGIRLAPRFYVNAPPDGIWDIDFYGEEPSGIVLPVVLPVAAYAEVGAPDWLKGFRIHAESNSIEVTSLESANPGRALGPSFFEQKVSGVIVRHRLASYEDSWQPIGHCGGLSVRMKKLVHDLTLTVEGPDEAKIRSCIQDAAGVGLIAAIVAVYATGGGALPAAVSAFLVDLTKCLGSGFSARVDDKSEWVEWCT